MPEAEMHMQSEVINDSGSAHQANAHVHGYAGDAVRVDLAHELHDTVIQPLTSLLLSITRFEYRPSRAETAETHLNMWKGLAQEALDSLRSSLAGLQAASAQIHNVPEAICRSLVRQLSLHGLHLSVESHNWLEDLPPHFNSNLYLAVREAVTNVEKHAAASKVCVVFRADAEGLSVTITDDGMGITHADLEDKRCSGPGRGLGISGIRDRVALLGGRAHWASVRGQGVRIAIWLPHPSPEDFSVPTPRPCTDAQGVAGGHIH